jgi:hypothetical protein
VNVGVPICRRRTTGLAEDGLVTTDTASLIRWYSGEISLGAALRAGGMSVAAPPWLVKQLARWGTLSPYAGVARSRAMAVIDDRGAFAPSAAM